MKKISLNLGIVMALLLTINLVSINSNAQSPHKMSYQAVIRNSSFNLVVNTAIGMKVSILQGSATGTAVYVETQTPTTNGNGLATIEIGSGTVVTGTIAAIDWAAGPYFIKTETDPAGGTTYSIANTSQLMSVPYSLYAKNSGSSTPGPQGPAGPTGPTGPMGPQGPAGVLSVNCLQCHEHNKNSQTYAGSFAEKRDRASDTYKHSKHAEGEETAWTEGSREGCGGCHGSQGFTERVLTNMQPTFTGTGPYSFAFNVSSGVTSNMADLPGTVSCFTCHKGNQSDSMALVKTDSVKLLFYAFPGKEKYVNLTQKGAKSNLCIMCHQARPNTENTTSGNGSNVDYPALALNLTGIFYDSTKTASTGNKVTLTSRSVGHYGWAGNVLAGKGFGPMEIPGGPVTYSNSAHKSVAACNSCHMAQAKIVNGEPTGNHTFTVIGNYNGCNVTGCHSSDPLSATHTKVTGAINAQKANMDTLAGLLKSKGQYMMAIDADSSIHPNYYYKTTLHFNGDLNIGTAAGTFTVNAATVPAGRYKWPTMTNGQFGAMQAFSVALREASGGIHNTKYTNALLTNAIWYLRANPIP